MEDRRRKKLINDYWLLINGSVALCENSVNSVFSCFNRREHKEDAESEDRRN